ncbi:MAG: PepSY-associated TM helix domain-containing protein [Methylocystis sp.]
MVGIDLPMRSLPVRRRIGLKTWREIWLKIHLWLGLALGLFLSTIGVTGSALVFWTEIDEWLNPELRIIATPPQSAVSWRPLEEIVNAAQKAIPADSNLGFSYWPQTEREAFLFYYRVKNPRSKQSDTMHVFVDPYTADVTGRRLWYSESDVFNASFIGFLFKLHYQLLAPGLGDIIVGIIAILAFVSSVTGIILWWPRNGKWHNAFTIKWPAKFERLNYDIHRLAGIFLFPVAVAVLLSGVYFNLPIQFRAAVEIFSQLTKVEKFGSTPPTHAHAPITLDEAFASVVRQFPRGRIYSVSLPTPKNGSYVFSQLFPIGWGLEGRRTIFVNQYDGDVLHVNDPLTGDGDGFIAWQWALHSGYVLGWPGRIAVFLFGLSWPLIFFTGVMRWLQKRRARRIVEPRRIRSADHSSTRRVFTSLPDVSSYTRVSKERQS